MPFTPNFKQATLTQTVNEMEGPLTFLRSLLFSREQPVATETIEIGEYSSVREIAGFKNPHAEADIVGGYARNLRHVEAPYIALKNPFTPSEILWGRQPAGAVYPGGEGEIRQKWNEHVARDMGLTIDMITNTEEWMASRALQGLIEYSVEDRASFSLDYGRSASHNITLSTFWDDASPTPLTDLFAVKKLQSESNMPIMTDAILGSEAADTFVALVEQGKIKLTNTTDNHTRIGEIDLTTQFSDQGVIYLGRVSSINFWHYGRTAEMDGVTQEMIRPKYAEFINRNNAAGASDRVMYYGAIADGVLEGKKLVGKRFSRSWFREDPAAQMFLVKSRPLPVLRRPDATVSMKVVSG